MNAVNVHGIQAAITTACMCVLSFSRVLAGGSFSSAESFSFPFHPHAEDVTVAVMEATSGAVLGHAR